MIGVTYQLVLDFASVKTPNKKAFVMRTGNDKLITVSNRNTTDGILVFDEDLHAHNSGHINKSSL